MDKHVAERWVQALRSGKYKQGRATLCTNDGSYCCLGVLCDLYRVEQGKGEWKKDTDCQKELMFEAARNESSTALLPKPVKIWAGMHTPNGEVGGDSLASLNDEGAEFPYLADLIESKWEVL